MSPSLLGERIALHFRGKNLTPSSCGQGYVLACIQREESLNSSPCGKGFVGRDSYAFRGEEKA